MGPHMGLRLAQALAANSNLLQWIFTTGVLICGYQFFTRGTISAWKTRTATMDTSVALGVGSAYVYSVAESVSQWLGKSPFRGGRWDVRNAGSFGTVSFDPSASPSRPRQTTTSKRSGALAPTLIILGVLAVVFMIFTTFYTDFLWYSSVDKSSVFTTLLATQLALFLVFGLIMATAIGVTMLIAYRSRPEIGVMSAEQISLERYRASLEPFHKVILIGIPTMFGVMAGMSASAQWQSWMTFRYATPFGTTDPQFNTDISFFALQYPFLRFVLGFMVAVLILCILMAAVTHYVYGGLRLQGAPPRTSRAAHVQLSILGGLFMLLKAVGYWLDRYGLAIKAEPLVDGFTGLKYRDVNAVLPAKNILVVIALVCAVLFFANAFRQGWTLPLVGHRPAGDLRAGHRRHLPGDRPAVPGQALGAGARAGVHQAQHRGHARRVRPGQGEVRGLLR